jgi:hypothetical protein
VRVELRVDPRPSLDAPAASTLPEPPPGFMTDLAPLFPGATASQGRVDPAPAGGMARSEVLLTTSRQPIEVLGFYADHLQLSGWSVRLTPDALEARSSDGRATVTVRIEGTAPTLARVVVLREPPG